MTEARDDSFQLYDLRVDIVCPPGERILCGAKEGDFFTLEGEMLYLPPGQGFSIYSLSSTWPQSPVDSSTDTSDRCRFTVTCGEAEAYGGK